MVEKTRSGSPQALIDVSGVVGQFLSDLTPYDIIIELIQNELDAGSKHTIISFKSNKLICEGNGKQIESAGWERLKYVLGAGGEVDAKIDGIGVKNHGLRSAFLIGDEISVQSIGHRIDHTARGSPADLSKFSPAVWPKIKDTEAPISGTRITIPYRSSPITIPNGDNIRLEIHSEKSIDSLFQDALKKSPSRFISASSPGKKWHYELTLEYRKIKYKFTFDCKPLSGKYSGLFLRTCQFKDSNKRSRILLRQLGSTFELNNIGQGKIPKLFRHREKIIGEISWNVDRNNMPLPGRGAFRYPISYPVEHESTGYGFDISGPFISGRARHSLSDIERNKIIKNAGFKAFISLCRTKLIPLFGASVLELIPSEGVQDISSEMYLTKAMLDEAAFPIAKFINGNKLEASIIRNPTLNHCLTIANPSYGPETISLDILKLGPENFHYLHPDSNKRVVGALIKLQQEGEKNVRLFNERDAVINILIQTAPTAGQVITNDWINKVRIGLCVLDQSRHRTNMPHEFTNLLKSKALLPTEYATAAPWSTVRINAKPVPPIPGIAEPEILHHQLAKLGMFKDAPFKIPKFNLNDFVSERNFSVVESSGRKHFFNWLKKGHKDLLPKTLAKIALYPIWPSISGEYRALDDYCWPASKRLRELIHSVNPAPSPEVINFPGLRKSANGALRLRNKPNDEELQLWYDSEAEKISTLLSTSDNDVVEALDILESNLDWLNQSTTFDIAGLAIGHKTLTKNGCYKEIDTLHAQTPLVECCGLEAEDLVEGKHHKLYLTLGAHERPTASALIRALVHNPDQNLLFNRLDAYKSLGLDLGDLSTQHIILVQSKYLPPNELAFPHKISIWGLWKTHLDKYPTIPDHIDLLTKSGVIKQAVREDLSIEFFDWLSNQPKNIQASHLQEILRHWGNRHEGPSHWATKFPSIPCIPVRGKIVDFELLSLNKALSARYAIFLEDMPEIQDLVIQDNNSARLTIVAAKGVTDSILDILKEVGVPSLRRKAGRPIKLQSSQDGNVDDGVEALLANAKSKNVIDSLTKRLPQHDVPSTSLRGEWRKYLMELKGTIITAELSAVYSVLNKNYEVPIDSGVDEPSQKIFIKQKGNPQLPFYEALAEYLFNEGSSELWTYGLLKSMETDYQPNLFDFRKNVETESEEDTEPTTFDKADSGDVPKKAHGLSPEKLLPVVPKPTPLRDITNATILSGKKIKPYFPPRRNSSTDHLRNTVEEEEQKRELKDNHYGGHCQACLGEYDVIKAAPPRTYVFLHSIRSKLLEAHHVEHLQNGGAIGASNLVVLCGYHHDALGDKLSSASILEAMTNAKNIIRSFPKNAEGTSFDKQQGLLIEMQLNGAQNLYMYFSKYHADAWKSQKR